MAESRDSIVILYIVGKRDCYKPIDDLVEKTKTSIGPSLFQCSPSKFILTFQLQKPCCQSYQKSSEEPFAGPFQF